MQEKPLFQPIEVRYDGLDAANNEIGLWQFGESLKGVSKIITVSAHFALRHEYIKRRDRSYVRVLARPARGGSFLIDVATIAASQYPLLAGIHPELTSKLVEKVVGAILPGKSGRREELEILKDTIQKLIEQQGVSDKGTRETLAEIVHHLIDANQPSVKSAVRPVGHSCGMIRVGSSESGTTVDLPKVESIKSEGELEVGEEQFYFGRIDSLTLHTRACKLEIEGHEGEYLSGKITDPQILLPENIYTLGMHERTRLRFTGKPLLRDGTTHSVYISDASQSEENE